MYRQSEFNISSGYSGDQFSSIAMVQNINISYSTPRQETNILGSTVPLPDRSVTNYIPIKYTIDLLKSDKEIESSLGLMNPSGVAVYLGSSSDIIGYGTRDINNKIVDEYTETYKYSTTVISGALQSYNISAAVGDIAKLSIVGEGIDYSVQKITGPYTHKTLNSNIIKGENIAISGIQFSGIGLSGLIIQSFSLNLSFNRQSRMRIGYQYPERFLIGAKGTISINGFLDGMNDNDSILQSNNGLPETGQYSFTLVPACTDYPSTTYTVKNPYIENYSLGSSIGSFTSVGIELSIPLPFNILELNTGSNIVIT